MQSALRHFSLRVRLVVLSTVLVAILAATTIYVTAKLAANSRAVAHVTELAKLINLAHEVQVAFGEYRYWVTDLAVSFLSQSEQNAKDSLLRLTSKLDEFGRARPHLATDLKKELAQFELYAMRSVEQYTDEQRVVGNTMLARARQHCVADNALLVGILLHRPHRIELELCELLLQIGRKMWTSAAELVEFARESQQ